ncbi:SatD family protein [Neorhodopirellula lusitana]|uniref:SatD family protein n=1 Tax=Neorhodopirellula lusitana TaxID=445327 RepID=UPI00384FA77F
MGKDARQSVYAVLTGDLVDSTGLDTTSREEARKLVLSSVAKLDDWSKKNVVRGKPEIFRGDQWQALLSQPKFALRAAIYVRAKLIATGCDTRVSIAIGAVDRISRTSISRSDGDAFVRSGHGLDEMKTDSELAISLPDSMHDSGRWLSAIAELSGAILSGWKKGQAEVVSLAIDPQNFNQSEIGKRLKTTQQLVSKALKATRWDALEVAIKSFEGFDWESIDLTGQAGGAPR